MLTYRQYGEKGNIMQRTMTIITVEVTKVDLENRTFETLGTIKVPAKTNLDKYLKERYGKGVYTTNIIEQDTALYKMSDMTFYDNAVRVEKEDTDNE